MKKFQSKPVTVEAVQLTIENYAEVRKWCNGLTWSRPPMRAVTGITIYTPDGNVDVEFGMWIIKGPRGFTAIPHEIFQSLYKEGHEEPLDEDGHEERKRHADELGNALADRLGIKDESDREGLRGSIEIALAQEWSRGYLAAEVACGRKGNEEE